MSASWRYKVFSKYLTYTLPMSCCYRTKFSLRRVGREQCCRQVQRRKYRSHGPFLRQRYSEELEIVYHLLTVAEVSLRPMIQAELVAWRRAGLARTCKRCSITCVKLVMLCAAREVALDNISPGLCQLCIICTNTAQVSGSRHQSSWRKRGHQKNLKSCLNSNLQTFEGFETF